MSSTKLKKDFFEVIDRFTNKAIFMTDDDGNVIRDSQGQLTKRPECLIQVLPPLRAKDSA